MRFQVLYVFVAAFVGSALTASISLKPCDSKAPDFDDCVSRMTDDIIAFFVKGEPRYKVPPLDPLLLEKIEVGNTTSQKPVGMSFTCRNCTIEGIKHAKTLTTKHDMKGRHMYLKGNIPQMNLKGDYSISGKVLLLPIVGEGKTDISLNDVNYEYKGEFVLNKGKENKDYLEIVDAVMDMKVGGSKIHFTNLFNGDKALGDQMNSFMNENWQEVIKEFGPAVGDAIKDLITLIINRVANEVPYYEVIIP